MTSTHRYLAAALTLAIVHSIGTAQHVHPVTRAVAAPVPIHTQRADSGFAYGTWAAGDRYKASFHDGATFVPYLGRQYPRAQSLKWRTLSVRVGETELCDGEAPRLSTTEWRAEYDLGGVVEAYDIRTNGLEQTFVIRERPRGLGDLVVRGAVTTGLRAATSSPAHQAIEFFDRNGDAILSYGAATAIDANGRRCPMTSAIVTGVITLQLSAEWLAHASYPIVVDPLLGTLFSAPHSNNKVTGNSDVARASSSPFHKVYFAIEEWANQGDSDIRMGRHWDSGLAYQLKYVDVTSSWSSTAPSLGIHRGAAAALLAFTRDLSNNTRKLRFHLSAFASPGYSTNWGAVNTGSSQAWRPDVATDLNPNASNHLLIVFQQEGGQTWYETTTSSIHGVSILLTGNGWAAPPFAIADAPFEDNERPRINKVRTASQEWTVANQVIGNSALLSPHTDWDIELRRVDRHGNVSVPTVHGYAQTHEMEPHLGGYDDTVMLALSTDSVSNLGGRPSASRARGIVTQRYDWNGASLTSSTPRFSSTTPAADRYVAGIALDLDTMSHYVVSSHHVANQALDLRIVGYDGGFLRTVRAVTGGATAVIPGGLAYDSSAARFLFSYAGASPSNTHARLDGYTHPLILPPTVSGTDCGATGQLSWFGSQLIGDESAGVRLNGLGPGALGAILVGTQSFSGSLANIPIVHSGCRLLVPNVGTGSLGTLPFAFGPSASYSFALPSWLPSMALYFQGVHFDASGTEVFTTQRLVVPLGK
ncbi:MAG: hypothetical protein NXI31_20750 [bacterium]|nr:hypothetical protein [bacterium]